MPQQPLLLLILPPIFILPILLLIFHLARGGIQLLVIGILWALLTGAVYCIWWMIRGEPKIEGWIVGVLALGLIVMGFRVGITISSLKSVFGPASYVVMYQGISMSPEKDRMTFEAFGPYLNWISAAIYEVGTDGKNLRFIQLCELGVDCKSAMATQFPTYQLVDDPIKEDYLYLPGTDKILVRPDQFYARHNSFMGLSPGAELRVGLLLILLGFSLPVIRVIT